MTTEIMEKVRGIDIKGISYVESYDLTERLIITSTTTVVWEEERAMEATGVSCIHTLTTSLSTCQRIW